MCVHVEIDMEVSTANKNQEILKIMKSSVGFSPLNFKTYYEALVIDIFEFYIGIKTKGKKAKKQMHAYMWT